MDKEGERWVGRGEEGEESSTKWRGNGHGVGRVEALESFLGGITSAAGVSCSELWLKKASTATKRPGEG